MTDIFSRPRPSTARILADIIVGVVLAAILAGLVIIVLVESAERGRRHGESVVPNQQNIPYGGKSC